jgi:hypothetical protein
MLSIIAQTFLPTPKFEAHIIALLNKKKGCQLAAFSDNS